MCGWWAWTCDGFDYFAVSVTLSELGKDFGKSDSQMSLAITLTLLFRSLGALIFGVLADRFGRKWTLVANMLIIAAFQLGSGFVTNYSQFLGVRAIFGIAMGGVWGQAAATALENVPAASRGFFSGIVQQGYTIGYLLAAVINMTVGSYSRPKWRSLYFIGAGFSVSSAIFRMCLPESVQFLRAREEQRAAGLNLSGKEAARHFFREIGHMLRSNWIRCIWAICVRFTASAELTSDHDGHELLLARLAGPLPDVPHQDQGPEQAQRERRRHHLQVRPPQGELTPAAVPWPAACSAGTSPRSSGGAGPSSSSVSGRRRGSPSGLSPTRSAASPPAASLSSPVCRAPGASS